MSTSRDETPLFLRLAAAFVRGKLAHADVASAEAALFTLPLDALDAAQQQALVALGQAHELRLHRFKRTMGLARVARVLGTLRGLGPANLLDVGSGRGAFLWPLLDAFPWLPVTAVDLLPHRVADMQAVAAGGVATLQAHQADVTALPFDDGAFEVVTMLEVLEHIPDTAAALRESLRVAGRFLLLSVPSKADDNPEHIHLFDAARLERLVQQAGAARVTCEYVPGHMIAIARKER
ncbi:MAG: class I SAM-dependent methyltransferase [Chloroflexaceae bacterium]|nr:class I SAM-dependent methyltransferase [Chloroflexaceae bacterium]